MPPTLPEQPDENIQNPGTVDPSSSSGSPLEETLSEETPAQNLPTQKPTVEPVGGASLPSIETPNDTASAAGGNDFYQPQSTTLEPNTPSKSGAPANDPTTRKAQVPGNDKAGNALSVVASQNAGKASEAAAKASKAKEIAGKAQSGDITGAAASAIGEKFGDGAAGKAARAAAETAADVANIARLAALDPTAILAGLKSAKHLLVRFKKPILIILLLYLVGWGVAGAAVFQAVQGAGDPTAHVGTGNQLNGSYCSQMQTTLAKNGKNLILPATEGSFSEESPVDTDGHVVDQTSFGTANPSGTPSVGPPDSSLGEKIGGIGGTLALWGNGFSQDPQSWWPYYVTARWPFQAWGWNSHGSAGNNLTPNDYVNVRVILYNPKTNKAVLGVIGESGPSPHEGISTAVKNAPTKTTVAAQQTLWGGINRTVSPQGSWTIVAGGPTPRRNVGTSLETALGITPGKGEGVAIKMGFAPASLQNTAPGPIDCSITGGGGNGSQPLNVPKTNEGSGGQCGVASEVSVARYYNPSFSDPSIYDAATQSITESASSSCVKPGFINEESGGKVSDFTYANLKSGGGTHVTMAEIEASLLGGDPVVFYGSPDPFYSATQNGDQHIFVLTGFNSSNGTFDVISPRTKGADDMTTGTVTTKRNNGQSITEAFLTAHEGDDNIGHNYGHSVMIRSKYLNQ